ncbi:MAG: uroporphyrinogen decarboxylase family protein [Clostridia bacterium]
MSIQPIRKPWKSIMSGRERFNNQMHYKPFDRTFNMEFGYWSENFDIWGIFKENGVKKNEEADVFFNFDRIDVMSGRTFMHPTFPYQVVEETLTTQVVMGAYGLLAEIPRDNHATIPHYSKPTVVTPEDWKKVKEERFDVNHPDRTMDIGKLKGMHPENRDYPLGVNCGSMIGSIRDMLSFEGLAYACYDYPDMVEDMVETTCRLVEHFLDQVLPHFDFDYAGGWEDICFNYGPIVTVDFFKNVVMPRYKRIDRKLKAHGIDLWYTDCDGDVRPILPYFLEGGINCMFPYEVNSCCHPAELFAEYGRDLRIMGGFDKMALLAGKEEIKKYMKSLEPLVARGGYIPFCDHRCPPDVTPENYIYYLDLKEKTFGLK